MVSFLFCPVMHIYATYLSPFVLLEPKIWPIFRVAPHFFSQKVLLHIFFFTKGVAPFDPKKKTKQNKTVDQKKNSTQKKKGVAPHSMRSLFYFAQFNP